VSECTEHSVSSLSLLPAETSGRHARTHTRARAHTLSAGCEVASIRQHSQSHRGSLTIPAQSRHDLVNCIRVIETSCTIPWMGDQATTMSVPSVQSDPPNSYDVFFFFFQFTEPSGRTRPWGWTEMNTRSKKSFLGVECGRGVRLTTLQPSVSLLSRQCGILNISQPYKPSQPITGIALLYFVYFYSKFSFAVLKLHK
jgi:hypothetical protein